MRLPVHIGRPTKLAGVLDHADDPEFAVVLGLVAWAFEQESHTGRRMRPTLAVPKVNIGETVHKIRDWVRTFMP